jgi:error-prone DNA polymerase
MVSFQCAWLKAHHPAVFLARVIANGGGFYSRHAYVEEARRAGVRILPPSVQHGSIRTAPAGARSMRLGLDTITRLSRKTMENIFRFRPFPTLDALRHVVKPTDTELQHLAWAGALEGISGWNPPTDQRLIDRHAFEVLACLPRIHPFSLWDLTNRRQHCADVIPQGRGRRVKLWAWPIAAREVQAHSAKNPDEPNPMGFVTLEDESGLCECVSFPKSYQNLGPKLDPMKPIPVEGRIEVEFGVATLVAA